MGAVKAHLGNPVVLHEDLQEVADGGSVRGSEGLESKSLRKLVEIEKLSLW